MTIDLKSFSSHHLPLINEEMLETIQVLASEDSLRESMRYSVIAGGKRLRPLLLLATLAFFDHKIEKGHYQLAAALEMIHTYSLIHDDLPAMDNDDLRRGQPTNHIVFGEGLAILAGDALLNEALYLVSDSELDNESKVWLMKQLTLAAGSAGMIGGQVADIEGEERPLSLDELQSVHRRKTGALIKFAVEAGSYLAKVDEHIFIEMGLFAENFGIAFQIKDDLLDVLGDEALIGKKTGMDATLNKSTYTSLLGVKGAQTALQEHYTKAIAALDEVKKIIGKPMEVSLLEQLIETLMV
ncbi:polyprenyl synthetase family protein [Vagococcus intermedius]|uniref:Farnesyl diphosphate synthase n=1 Tax=Vagococcus intermedius TaxID=2991418 RepID=A0AAF0I8D6_9ENTE|nr:farnesyl diphosphate synthase [Vagococcus intermedius]WEG73846.1 polyprenyl synthetase family protein [Vagococcus intermedius]WEG75931.1 polyprenyl synthetase family protein [Vagococcus intermedius]